MGHDAYDKAVERRNYNPPSISWVPAHPANAEDESCDGYRPDDRTMGAACLPNTLVQPPPAAPSPIGTQRDELDSSSGEANGDE